DNCTVRSSASAVKFGTASHGGFKNIVVKNIKVYDTYRSAIALEAVDGGILEDITVRDIDARNTGNAIFIRLGHRNKDSVYSIVRNIHISNVKAVIPAGKPDAGYPMEGPLSRFPHNVFPASIAGLPGHPVENVQLDSIDIRYEAGASKDSAYMPVDSLAAVPERASDYPEFSMFGELPAWGWFLRHATGIRFTHCSVTAVKPDYRAAIAADYVKGLELKGMQVKAVNRQQQLILRNVTKPMLQGVSGIATKKLR
ncbi:MAG: glycoside hydrolase family 28, partial [Bacteroidota bacterium]|nr:glycoside hydrolase family 28 [Bacteroidota bacterium]